MFIVVCRYYQRVARKSVSYPTNWRLHTPSVFGGWIIDKYTMEETLYDDNEYFNKCLRYEVI